MKNILFMIVCNISVLLMLGCGKTNSRQMVDNTEAAPISNVSNSEAVLSMANPETVVKNGATSSFTVNSYKTPAVTALKVVKHGSLYDASVLCVTLNSEAPASCMAGTQSQPLTSFRAKFMPLPPDGIKSVPVPTAETFINAVNSKPNANNNGVDFIGLSRAGASGITSEVLMIEVAYAVGVKTFTAYKAFKIDGF